MTIKTIKQLQNNELISDQEAKALESGAGLFQTQITDDVLKTIKSKNANDPIYSQYVPRAEEFDLQKDELNDPIGDGAHRVTRGLIHRYKDRVLFKVTQACAVYCRFCFRRELLGDEDRALNAEDINNALNYIEQHTKISEVIFSGGDPFILSPRRLKDLVSRLSDMEHIEFIRFHTRIPVVKPSTITPEFCAALQSNKRIIVSVHTNHAQELSDKARQAIQLLDETGVSLISQTVLLRGINDKPETLIPLFKQLMLFNIKPAYLHHPDKAKGTSHFRVSIEEGMRIFKSLRGQISGHCLPQYVLDIPGGFGKVPVTSDWIKRQEDGTYLVTDVHGDEHIYKD